MGNYPYYVQTARYVLDQFFCEWQNDPCRWYQEIDVQAELSSRLQTIFSLVGDHTVSKPNYYKPSVIGKTAEFSRVTCQPRISYVYSDKKRYYCYPDIVIWDDAEITEFEAIDDGNWPMLWVCEIKYTNQKTGKWDEEKLGYLISQKLTKFGCWVRMKIERATSGNGITWNTKLMDSKLWICDVTLPSAK